MTANTVEINLPADNATVTAVVSLVKDELRVQNKRGAYGTYVAEFGVTRGTVNEHAVALAALVTKPGVQKDRDGNRTRYGNALNTIKKGLRDNLPTDESDKPVVLRASLSGEGGGTVTIPTDHALYAVLVEMIAGQHAENAA